MANARGPKRAAYQKAYNAQPENVAKRVANNAARREAIRQGKAKVGDGKDVDHKTPQDRGGGNTPSNLRVVDQKTNRGWRGRDPGMYSKRKK